MDGPTLLRRYAQGKRDFAWADLAGANLAQAQLSGINLSRANLSGATLVGANLSEANLTKANLAGANLSGATLTGATLRRANLTAAQIDLTQLQQVDYYGAVLPSALVALLPPDDALELEEPLVQKANPLTPALAGPEQSSHSKPQALNRQAANQPDTYQPDTHQTAIDRRELWISLALLALGYLCYGVVLRMHQVAWPGWWLVSLPLGLGLWQEELVWFVPLVGLVGAMVALGVSVGVLIFAVPVALSIGVALAIGGSILGWGWGQTLKTTAWFSGLAFVAMHSSIWLFDGSNAYGGGGIVVNLSGIHTAALLGLGLLAVGRGTLAYGQLIDQGYPTRHQGMLIGGSGVMGLLLGWLVGG